MKIVSRVSYSRNLILVLTVFVVTHLLPPNLSAAAPDIFEQSTAGAQASSSQALGTQKQIEKIEEQQEILDTIQARIAGMENAKKEQAIEIETLPPTPLIGKGQSEMYSGLSFLSSEENVHPPKDILDAVEEFIQCAAEYVQSNTSSNEGISIDDQIRIKPHSGLSASADKYFVSYDGRYVLTAESHVLSLYLLQGGKEVRSFNVPDSIGEFAMGMSPDNRYVYVVSQNSPSSMAEGLTQFEDILQGLMTQEDNQEAAIDIEDPLKMMQMLFGGSVAGGNAHHTSLLVFDALTGKEQARCRLSEQLPNLPMQSMTQGGFPHITRFSPDGSLLIHSYYSSEAGTLGDGTEMNLEQLEKRLGVWDVQENSWSLDLQQTSEAASYLGNSINASELAFAKENQFVAMKLNFNVFSSLNEALFSSNQEIKEEVLEKMSLMWGIPKETLKEMLSMDAPLPAQSLVLYDIQSGELVKILRSSVFNSSDDFNTIALSDDGRFVMARNDDLGTMLFDREKDAESEGRWLAGILGTAFLSGEHRALFHENNSLAVRDVVDFTAHQRYREFVREMRFALNPDSRRLHISAGGGFETMNTDSWVLIEKETTGAFDGSSIFQMLSPDGQFALIFSNEGGRHFLSKVDAATQKVIWKSDDPTIFPIWKIAISPNGKYMVAVHSVPGSADVKHILHDFTTGKAIQTFRTMPSLFSLDYFFTPDNELIILENRVPLGRDAQVEAMIKEMFAGMPAEQYEKTKKHMLERVQQEDQTALLLGNKNTIVLLDPTTLEERILTQRDFTFDDAILSDDGSFLAFTFEKLTEKKKNLYVLAAPFTGEPRFLTTLGQKDQDGFEGLDWGPNGERLLVRRQNSVGIIEIATGEFVKEFAVGRGVKKAVLADDMRYLYSQGETLRIHSYETAELLAEYVLFRDGEWITVTPEGHFALSSIEAAKRMDVSFGIDAYSINQFYDLFFQPALVREKLQGKVQQANESLTMEEVLRHPPPMVSIESVTEMDGGKNVHLKYRVQSMGGGGIGEIRIFNNGKLVYSDGEYEDPISKTPELIASESGGESYRGDRASVLISGPDKRTVIIPWQVQSPKKGDVFAGEISIDTIPGENEIGIVAFNSKNNVESVQDTFVYHSKQEAEPADLYILAIGIDEYKDPGSKLRFAVKDAHDFVAKVEELQIPRYQEDKIHIKTILNTQATRENILQELANMAKKVRLIDNFILFVAGHGVLLDGGRYAILTHEFDGNPGSDKTTLATDEIIGSHEIMTALQKIPALHQIVILDTCYAGGIDNLVKDLYSTRMSAFAKRMGLHIYSSASSVEGAFEGYQNNGLFTYALLDGLSNNRDVDTDNDSKVSVREWGEYAKKETEAIATTLNHKQTPTVINFGSNQVVYELK